METKLKCHLIESTPIKSDFDYLHENFIHVKTLIDNSHLFRYILKCNKCGQLYFYEFYEVINWSGGNDSQYNTYIPVDTIEEAERLHNDSPLKLLGKFPRLQCDFVGDTSTIRWIR